MADEMDRVISGIADPLMRAVVRSGCIRTGRESDLTLGCKVMREELKALIIADQDPAGKYKDERELARFGWNSHLVMASVTAECIKRILAERDA